MQSPTTRVSRRPPLPREHGAWGLLFQPLLAAVALSGIWTSSYLAVAGMLLGAFLMREPLIVWLRHRVVWKRDAPEARAARNWALAFGAAAGVCGLVLTGAVPFPVLGIMCGAGAALTAASIVLTLRQRQRSLLLQTISAAGLTASPLLVAAAATRTIPAWAWILWALLAAHAIAALPVVHARLEARAHRESAPRLERLAGAIQVPSVAAAALLWAAGSWLATPLGFSALANLAEWLRLRRRWRLDERLHRVGFRLLAASVLHTLLAVVALRRGGTPL
jgi:hypothetical protein